MSLFKNTLARIFDSGRESALSLLEDAQRTFESFDFDSTIGSIVERGNSLCNTLSEFGKTIKDTVSDFKVIVPFDESKEELNYRVEGHTLFIRVNTKGGFRELTASIPNNAIIDKIRLHVNNKKNEAVIIIPKNIAEDDGVKTLKDETLKKINTIVDSIMETVSNITDKDDTDGTVEDLEIELEVPVSEETTEETLDVMNGDPGVVTPTKKAPKKKTTGTKKAPKVTTKVKVEGDDSGNVKVTTKSKSKKKN